ncbi:hypothetical protein EN933_38730, partial [Mesorhizobium sp. M7A.F.Ca.US.001.01.1.1]
MLVLQLCRLLAPRTRDGRQIRHARPIFLDRALAAGRSRLRSLTPAARSDLRFVGRRYSVARSKGETDMAKALTIGAPRHPAMSTAYE